MKTALKQSGATLLEALSFLVISAIVVIGAVSLIDQGFSATDVGNHSKEINAIKVSLSGAYKGTGSYSGITTDSVVGLGLVPQSMIVTGVEPNRMIVNTYGGSFDVVGSDTNFTITSRNVNKTACAQIVTQIGDFISIKIGSSPERLRTISLDTAVADCQAGASPNDIIIVAN